MKKPVQKQPPPAPVSAGNGLTWEKVGFCTYCLMSIEAKQPGGLDPRHIQTQVPYGECPQGISAKKQQAEAQFVREHECTCTKCGCTDSKACPGGCYWTVVDRAAGTGICSSCA